MAETIRLETDMVFDACPLPDLMAQFSEEDGARLLQMYQSQIVPEETALDALCRRSMAFYFRKKNMYLPAKYRLKGVACLLVMILISGIIVCCFSPEARASMLRWITRREDSAVTYSPVVDESDEGIFLQYTLSKLPQEYALLEELSQAIPGALFYENPEGKQVTFFFQPPDGRGTLYMIPGEDTIEQVCVNGATADLYLPADPGKSTSIVWTDPKTGYLLMVKGVFSREMILELAESVQLITK